ncbi:hypothetical protein, partial [Escherichia coli]|uniref:hypothetical protein n=1 Tax=Escherichia coli TaxID=562 RepID=UPI003EDFD461
LHDHNTQQKTPGSTTNMRISNIEWLKKRIGFIRKLGEQTARQDRTEPERVKSPSRGFSMGF